jgi:uncharacterized protein YqfB (UPF0267 family)
VRLDAEGTRWAVMDTRSESHSVAAERLNVAREERDRRAGEYDSASGSPDELPAFTELRAAEEQFAAREAWLKWIDRDY